MNIIETTMQGESAWGQVIESLSPLIVFACVIYPVIILGGIAGLPMLYKAIFYDSAAWFVKKFKFHKLCREYRGKAGECAVNGFLFNLSKRDYRIEHDMRVRTAGGRPAQIDHLVFSRHGIFVIETKNYNGEVIGNVANSKWRIKYGKKVYTRENPLVQNKRHVEVLSTITELPVTSFFNIVVLFGGMKFKYKSHDNNYMSPWRMLKFIRRQEKVRFSHGQIGVVIDAVENARVKNVREASEDVKQEHVANLRERHSDEKSVAESPQQSYTVLRKLQVSVDGRAMTIDRVVFSRYGIFVIADINYNNYIYAEELRPQWANKPSTQETNFFNNPLLQNKKYIEALRAITKLPEEVFFNMVVFADNAQLRTRERLPESVCVGKSGMRAFIHKQTQHRLFDKQLETALNVVRNTR